MSTPTEVLNPLSIPGSGEAAESAVGQRQQAAARPDRPVHERAQHLPHPRPAAEHEGASCKACHYQNMLTYVLLSVVVRQMMVRIHLMK